MNPQPADGDCRTLLGIDLAVAPENSGLAIAGRGPAGGWILRHAARGRKSPLLGQILEVLDDDAPLVCLDAPLGWPDTLGRALAGHRAGTALEAPPDALFTRMTDHHIRRRLGKKPLDVGADRIARTAWAALRLLEGLREALGRPLPLLLDASGTAAGRVIETYPAATLRAHSVAARGYKARAGEPIRRDIARWLADHLAMTGAQRDACSRSDHVLDAALCVLAGLDVLHGQAPAPEDPCLAAREGWIWCRDPDGSGA